MSIPEKIVVDIDSLEDVRPYPPFEIISQNIHRPHGTILRFEVLEPENLFTGSFLEYKKLGSSAFEPIEQGSFKLHFNGKPVRHGTQFARTFASDGKFAYSEYENFHEGELADTLLQIADYSDPERGVIFERRTFEHNNLQNSAGLEVVMDKKNGNKASFSSEEGGVDQEKTEKLRGSLARIKFEDNFKYLFGWLDKKSKSDRYLAQVIAATGRIRPS